MRDNIPNRRFPIATVLLAGFTLVATAAQGELLLGLLAGWWVVLYGRSIEEQLGRLRTALLYVLFAACIALTITVVHLSHGQPLLWLLQIPALLVGSHLSIWPRARMMTTFVLPVFSSLIELPSALFAAVWVAVETVVLDVKFSQLTHLESLTVPLLAVLLSAVLTRATNYGRPAIPQSFYQPKQQVGEL